MLKAVGKFIVALNGNAKKSQIAAGFAWGLLLGLVPAGNFFGIVLFIVSFFFNHNHGSKILGMAVIKLLAPVIAPAIDIFGWQILHIESLQPIFITMFNMPFVPLTKFNNTLVMGGLAGGLLLWLPVFFLFLALIPLYRNHIAPKFKESKFIKKIAGSPFLKLIDKALFN